MNHKTHFVLENDVFREGLEDLKYAIDTLGHSYTTVGYKPFIDIKDYGLSIDYIKEPVVFYGSLNFAGHVRRNCKWLPGLYCDLNKLKCSHYYAYLGKFLLNKDYMMLPFGELSRRKDELFDLYGVDNTIYIRPDLGIKQFTGTIIYKEKFEYKLNRIAWRNVDNDSLVVVSSPKNINEEYRIVIIDKEPIAGSRYRKNGIFDTHKVCPKEIYDYAKHVAETFCPDEAFVVDVCTTNNGIFLVELNSFSCSGFYESDKHVIVKAIADLAYREWKDFFTT